MEDEVDISLFGFLVLLQMEHDRQMALKQEAETATARKKLSEVQRGALHVQMQEREVLKREVWAEPTGRTDEC